jgi:hypothetical protein
VDIEVSPGHHHRQILGPTPGEDGLDGSLFDGQSTVVRRHLPERLVARPSGAGEHVLDTLPGRRHDRKPIGYAFLEPDLEFVNVFHACDAVPRLRLPTIPERIHGCV